MAWITDHAEAAVTFVLALLLNAWALAWGYSRMNKRVEYLEDCQKNCAVTFVRADVLGPQLENIKKQMEEMKKNFREDMTVLQADVKVLLGMRHD